MVDLEIYLRQVILYFDKNPDDLRRLIGDLDKHMFYEKIKHVAKINLKENDDASLTRTQLIEIVVQMHREINGEVITNPVMKTKIGDIYLN